MPFMVNVVSSTLIRFMKNASLLNRIQRQRVILLTFPTSLSAKVSAGLWCTYPSFLIPLIGKLLKTVYLQ